MILTQKQKSDIISYYVGGNVYPRKYTRQYYVNDDEYSKNDVLRLLDEGDRLRVRILHITKYHVYHVDTVYIDLIYTDYIDDWIQRKKQQNRTWEKYRDYQRQRVYDFEKLVLMNCTKYRLTAEEIERLYNFIYASLGIDPGCLPCVNVTRKNKRTSSSSSWQITLAHGWGQQIDVVLHELAHDIVRKLNEKEDRTSHGKTFVGIVIALYELFVPGWKHDYAIHQLNVHNVKWSVVEYMKTKRAFMGKESLPLGLRYETNRDEALLDYKKKYQSVEFGVK